MKPKEQQLVNFFSVPKKILNDPLFQLASLSEKVIVIYLLASCNSLRKPVFWKKISEFSKEMGMNRITIWRAENGLKDLGIKIYKKNGKIFFDLTDLLKNYFEYRELLKSEQIVTYSEQNVT